MKKIFFKLLTIQFDIIVISETWLYKDTTPYYNLVGYDAFHIVRGNRKGDGVVIYLRRSSMLIMKMLI